MSSSQVDPKSRLYGPLVIRADATPRMGSGHLMRCLALAQAWRDQGGHMAFVSACENSAIREQIMNQGFQFIAVSRGDGEDTTPVSLWRLGQDRFKSTIPPWICLDGYHFASSYQQALKETGFRVLVVDDMCHLPHYHADVILNQNFRSVRSYPCDLGTRLLMGQPYVLIREEFLQWKDWRRAIPEKAGKILVTLGGGDSGKIFERIVTAIESTSMAELEITIIAGSSAQGLEEMIGSSRKGGCRFRLLKYATEMPGLMAWADIAVSGGGSTCWELAYMGLPSIVGILADNQKSVAQSVADMETGLNLGWFNELDAKEIGKALVALISDAGMRREMSSKGRKMIDGLGAKRVCEELVRAV